jgi:hypothetical protein
MNAEEVVTRHLGARDQCTTGGGHEALGGL